MGLQQPRGRFVEIYHQEGPVRFFRPDSKPPLRKGRGIFFALLFGYLGVWVVNYPPPSAIRHALPSSASWPRRSRNPNQTPGPGPPCPIARDNAPAQIGRAHV